MHPILVALWRHPELFAAHAVNYGPLVRQESAGVARVIFRRVMAGALTVMMTMVAMLLTGTSLLFGVVYEEFSWSLVIVPAICWAAAVIGVVAATRPIGTASFDLLNAQVHADVLLFRSVGHSVAHPTRRDV